MFQSLARNGLVKRSLVPRRPISATVTRHFLNNSHKSQLQTILHISYIRVLSTSGPSTTESKGKSSQPSPVVPPPPPAQRKHKVELRPGPVKPSKSTPGVPESSHSLGPPKHEVNLHPNGVTEATKDDIADAQAHGILLPPPPGSSQVGAFWHNMKQYMKFYFNGVRLILRNRNEAASIKARVKAGGAPLTRPESRFVRTSQIDVLKFIPFIIIALVLEEIIPVIAIYAPFILPSTCILPSQQARIEEKKRERQLSHLNSLKLARVNLAALRDQHKYDLPLGALGPYAQDLCGLLQLPTWGPNALRLFKIDRHLRFIAKDDFLLSQDKYWQSMGTKELEHALHERGVITSGLSSEEARKWMKWWLDNVDGQGNVDDLVSRRLFVLTKMVKE